MVWGHGLTSSRARDDDLRLLDWDRLARATRLVRYDARGHGRSGSSTVPADSSWSSLARDQLALADALGVGRSGLEADDVDTAFAARREALRGEFRDLSVGDFSSIR